MKTINSVFRYLSIFPVFCLAIAAAQGQRMPERRRAMPDFVFTDMSNYRKQQATLADFRGRWLILDFWSTRCTACILSFPKLNALQQRFSGAIQIVLVGKNDQRYNGHIRSLYERLRVRQQLDLVAAFDSVVFEQWNIRTVPRAIIVNPDGVVEAVTTGASITEDNIRALLEGKQVEFPLPPELAYDRAGNPSPEAMGSSAANGQLIAGSGISRWAPGDHPYPFAHIRPAEDSPAITANRVSLEQLYRLAFAGAISWIPGDSQYGLVYPFLSLETADTSWFRHDYNTGQNLFNYRFRLTGRTLDHPALREILKRDLQRAFGYRACVERRSVPVWVLTAGKDAEARLRPDRKQRPSGKADEGLHSAITGFSKHEYPFPKLLHSLTRYLQANEPPYFDETGITGQVDVVINALLTDRDEIQRELRKYDLYLTKGMKEMDVIVIRDFVGK